MLKHQRKDIHWPSYVGNRITHRELFGAQYEFSNVLSADVKSLGVQGWHLQLMRKFARRGENPMLKIRCVTVDMKKGLAPGDPVSEMFLSLENYRPWTIYFSLSTL